MYFIGVSYRVAKVSILWVLLVESTNFVLI
jgi:hypothetical protein